VNVMGESFLDWARVTLDGTHIQPHRRPRMKVQVVNLPSGKVQSLHLKEPSIRHVTTLHNCPKHHQGRLLQSWIPSLEF
jgi:hypothetical protein